MRRPEPLRWIAPILTGVLVVSVAPRGVLHRAAAGDSEAVDLSAHYGFEGPEIFKLQQRSHSLQAGDFNQDGRTDLVLVDNSHSRLDLLLQRTAPPEVEEPPMSSNVNEISSHWRFEHKKLPVDYSVASLTSGDFNGDGRTDLAYFGEPDRLIIRFQPQSGEWDDKQTIRLADVEAQPWSVAAGDINADGRDDLVVLGRRFSYLLYQPEQGRFTSPEKIRNTAERLGLAMIADIDGDGRNDLFYLADDADQRKACCRLQKSSGQLGPEVRFDLEASRGLILYDCVPGAGREVLNIDGKTGRVRISQFAEVADEDTDVRTRLVQYGFGESGSARDRDLDTGDVNGDGLTDVVVTDSDAAQVIVFLQHAELGLDLGAAFPSFLGVEQVRLADADGDGRDEVFVLSSKEQALGVSQYEGDRLTFPLALPISGEPVAFELLSRAADEPPQIVYLEKVRRSDFKLHRLKRDESGDWQTEGTATELSLPNEPNYMQSLDANQDGRPDLLLTSSVGRDPTLLVSDENSAFKVAQTQGGLQLGDVQHGAVFIGDLDGPVTLVAQRNFARSVLLGEDGRWQVLDQFNPAESNAKIEGVATLDLDEQPGDELVLVDTGVNKLRLLRREGGRFLPYKEIELGTFPFIAAEVADLNGDDKPDLLLFGPGRFATLYTGRRLPQLKEVATFESKLDDVFFADLVAGDLNHDGQPDIAIFDMRSHYLEILTQRGETLTHALHFKVFEEKSFTRRRGEGGQPREAVIADVTGDGRNDLILLAHDRVLLYPQDDGRSETPSAATAKPDE